MGHGIVVDTDAGPIKVDARDVADWEGRSVADPDDPMWRSIAERYVDAHPRPAARFSDGQRVAILRCLAAGPADTRSVLRAMRQVGYVGASDLENRLRDLRATGKRGGDHAAALPVVSDGDVHRLTQPLPLLDDLQRTALGHVKTLVARQPTPLVGHAMQVLDGLLPGVGATTGADGNRTMRLGTADMQRFEHARTTRTPVSVEYHSMNSGRTKSYLLVPVTYVPTGPAMKAVCVEVDRDGNPGEERQFALERIHRVRDADMPPLAEPIHLRTEPLHLVVMRDLYRIMADRNQFNISGFEARELPDSDHWEVYGEFPVVLGWDVMEQMCAWAGSVVVYQPLWLVNAVMRRLHAGLSAMQDSELRLEKPRPGEAFADLEDALFRVEPDPVVAPVGPTKLAPPPRRTS